MCYCIKYKQNIIHLQLYKYVYKIVDVYVCVSVSYYYSPNTPKSTVLYKPLVNGIIINIRTS